MLETFLYLSRQTAQCDARAIASILKSARRNNPALGLTGLLLHGEGEFAQVLEGPPASIDALIELLAVDPRHTEMVTLMRGPIETREFPEWSIASCEIEGSLDCVGASRNAVEKTLFGARPLDTITFMRGFYQRIREGVQV